MSKPRHTLNIFVQTALYAWLTATDPCFAEKPVIQQLVQFAIQNNPELAQAQANLDQRSAQWAQGLGEFFPQAGISYSYLTQTQLSDAFAQHFSRRAEHGSPGFELEPPQWRAHSEWPTAEGAIRRGSSTPMGGSKVDHHRGRRLSILGVVLPARCGVHIYFGGSSCQPGPLQIEELSHEWATHGVGAARD